MNAARFYGKRDVRVEPVSEPSTPGVDQVLIQTEWCGICGSDLHEYRAGPIQIPVEPHPLTGAKLPQILGHEFAGSVIAAGDAAGAVEGQRVAVMPLVVCGRCASCRRGLGQLCAKRGAIGMAHPWGGLAPYALVDGSNLVELPPELSTVQGALLEPTAVSVTAVRRAGVGPGTSVLVTGGGPIGALVVLAAAAAGVGVIIISEPSKARAEVMRTLGEVTVVDPTSDPIEGVVAGLTEGEGVDVAFECVGNQAALAGCIRSARPAGIVVMCGLHAEPTSVDVTACVEKQLSLLGSYCYDTHDWSDAVALVASGSLPAERIVTRRIGLEDVVVSGFEPLIRPGTGDVKILVKTC